MGAVAADVVIYAASADHPLGRPVRRLLGFDEAGEAATVGIGSVLLLSEILSRPRASRAQDELEAVGAVTARIDLRPVDANTARLAAVLGAKYRLRTADAVRLATAVLTGADRFISTNTRDLSPSISEITAVFPQNL